MIEARRFATYIGVGLICALVDIGLMQGLIWLGGPLMVATSIGFIAGLLLNFALHTRITFSAAFSKRAFTRYLVVVLANYLLTLLCVVAFDHWFQQALLGKLISLPLVAVNGFVLGRQWIYARSA